MSGAKLLVLYALFGALSVAINIVSQILFVWAYEGLFAIELSILVGTATGLPLRYYLEKRFIFCFKSKNFAQDRKIFFLYVCMAVITTMIFWTTEYAFHFIYDTETMRYVGGATGLTIGFFLKYQLDKKYVFVRNDDEVLA